MAISGTYNVGWEDDDTEKLIVVLLTSDSRYTTGGPHTNAVFYNPIHTSATRRRAELYSRSLEPAQLLIHAIQSSTGDQDIYYQLLFIIPHT